MAASLCVLAAGFWIGSGALVSWMIAGGLAAYVGCFAIGLGPVFWLLISEIFQLAIRSTGMSAATIAHWLANLVVALTFLDLVDWIGRPGVCLLYAALTAGALLFARDGAGDEGSRPGGSGCAMGVARSPHIKFSVTFSCDRC